MLEADARLTLAEREKPEARPGEMLVRVERAGICGSDLRMAPTLPPGTVLGHEFVGRVESLGDDRSPFAAGDRVCSVPAIGCGACPSCDEGDPVHCAESRLIGFGQRTGAFAERLVVGVRESLPVPGGVPVESAALVEPLAVAVKAIERASVAPGERLGVIGAGPIGLGVVLYATACGVRDILVSDPAPERRELALRLGATSAVGVDSSELRVAAYGAFGGRPDVVVETAGAHGSLGAATQLARREGRIVIAGMHEADETIPTRSAFLRDLTIRFSSSYRRRHFEHVLELLGQGRLDPSPMIDSVIGLDELPAVFARARAGAATGKLLINPA